MKRITMAIVLLILVSFAALASGQSLGDVARQQKGTPKKKAAKVYTNDDIPSVAPTPSASETPASSTAKTNQKKDAEATQEDSKKRAEEYKARIAEAKTKVADLEREIDLMQREQKLRAAVYFSDAGNRLRDDKKWADEERRFSTSLAAKQSDLQVSKQKLEALQDEARKAGVGGALD